MPFEWSESNINQTSVVHEELVIPKQVGDLLVSGFSMYVNGIKLSDDISTIDDFFSDGRVVHFRATKKKSREHCWLCLYNPSVFPRLHSTARYILMCEIPVTPKQSKAR